MTPQTPLEPGERVIESFAPDRRTYLRDHAWLAVLAMAGGMAVLWLLGNPYLWTGAVGGLAAIALRGWYLASEELSARWDLTDRRLLGPGDRSVSLDRIDKVRVIASAVQVISLDGRKHLIRFLPDPQAARRAIEAARPG
ncbi:hypothetical protein F3S47_04735 [Histidinibacterium aquaticum]|uniref:PH domain-containing protein n=1 Tax=Histidinibacterium aquaticum TaxID=2613962 RepID=A0A5J5GR46_9RHOB|nr:hypothetical protein F3S47_04735 [Histidinibacterium aquaticum]